MRTAPREISSATCFAHGFETPRRRGLGVLEEQAQGLDRVGDDFPEGVRCREASGNLGKSNPVGAVGILVDYGNVMHCFSPQVQPTSLAMFRAVPSGRSFFGWGTITVIAPFRNLWCDPLMFTNSKPSAFRRLTMSRLLRSMRNYIHTAAAGSIPIQPLRGVAIGTFTSQNLLAKPFAFAYTPQSFANQPLEINNKAFPPDNPGEQQ